MKATTVKEVLIAAHYLLKEGKVKWSQGTLFRDLNGTQKYDYIGLHPPLDQIGSCCLVGCLKLIEVDNPYLTGDAITKLAKVDVGCNLAYWNDRPERTKEQVIALLEEAIKAEP